MAIAVQFELIDKIQSSQSIKRTIEAYKYGIEPPDENDEVRGISLPAAALRLLTTNNYFAGYGTSLGELYRPMSLPPPQSIFSYVKTFLPAFPGLTRILIGALFVMSFLFSPFIQAVGIMLLRISEEGKPISALLLGAVGALVKAIQDVATKL